MAALVTQDSSSASDFEARRAGAKRRGGARGGRGAKAERNRPEARRWRRIWGHSGGVRRRSEAEQMSWRPTSTRRRRQRSGALGPWGQRVRMGVAGAVAARAVQRRAGVGGVGSEEGRENGYDMWARPRDGLVGKKRAKPLPCHHNTTQKGSGGQSCTVLIVGVSIVPGFIVGG